MSSTKYLLVNNAVNAMDLEHSMSLDFSSFVDLFTEVFVQTCLSVAHLIPLQVVLC